MGIAGCRAVSRKMLVCCHHFPGVQSVHDRLTHGGYDEGICSEGSSAHNCIFRICQDIRAWSEVHIETELRQVRTHPVTDVICSLHVSGRTDVCHISDIFAVNDPAPVHAGYGSAFLIHAEKSRQAGAGETDILHPRQHFLNLLCAFQVWLHVDHSACRNRIKRGSRHFPRGCHKAAARKLFRKNDEKLGNFIFQRHTRQNPVDLSRFSGHMHRPFPCLCFRHSLCDCFRSGHLFCCGFIFRNLFRHWIRLCLCCCLCLHFCFRHGFRLRFISAAMPHTE